MFLLLLTCQRRPLIGKIRRPSLSRSSQTKVLPFLDLPGLRVQNRYLHLALPRVMQLCLHPSIECRDVVNALHEVRDAARAVVGLGEAVRDSFLTFNNIMSTQNKILDKLNQNVEKLSRRNISDERGEKRRRSQSRSPHQGGIGAVIYLHLTPLSQGNSN